MVHRVKIIEVETAVRETRRIGPVHEIIVGRYGQRPESAGLQLDTQAVAESGFSRAAGSGNQDHARRRFAMVTAVDFLGDLDDFLFLQGFRHLDQFARPAIRTGLVHIAHRCQPHDDVPPQGLLEHLEGLGLIHEGSQHRGVMQVRYAQQQTAVIQLDIPHRQVTGRGDQFPIIVVGRIPQGIIVRIGLSQAFQQFHLIVITALLEGLDGLFRLHVVPVERNIFRHDLLHPFFQPGHVLHGQLPLIRLAQVAEKAVRDGMLHIDPATREDIGGALAQQEAQGTAIHPHAAGRPHVQVFDVPVLVGTEFQALRNIVHPGGYNRERPLEFKFVQHVQQRSPLDELLGGVAVFAVNLDHIGR